jgi:hypothetical protein
MTANDTLYTHVDHPAEVERLMEVVYAPGACIVPEDHQVKLPAVVAPGADAGTLQLDLTAIAKHIGGLLAGKGFRLVGDNQHGRLRTQVLTIRRTWQDDQRLYGACDFPARVEKMQRRDSFRARLRRGMHVDVDLREGEHTATGTLRDLSMQGCQAELTPSAVVVIEYGNKPLQLKLTFPNGTTFTARARPQHPRVENDRLVCGFRFDLAPAEQPQLWRLVHETEREAACSAASATARLRRSPLYAGDTRRDRRVSDAGNDATSTARRLARHADFLSLQLLQLRHGLPIDSPSLSRQADDLLALHEAGREQLLFAVGCFDHELVPVIHGLAVAVRMLDMSAALRLPHDLRKALAAAAMVHDLGKALLPAELTRAAKLNRTQYQQLQQHVALLSERLEACTWLAPAARDAMVEGINERLDGSGYPNQRRDTELHQLTRLAAIIDVVDAMGRDRPDRPAMPIQQIYAHLKHSSTQFDARWLARYIEHFGRWPVGTLVGFRGAKRGWVRALDEAAELKEVQLVRTITGTAAAAGGPILSGRQLQQLGEPVQAIPTSS